MELGRVAIGPARVFLLFHSHDLPTDGGRQPVRRQLRPRMWL
jgi:hypothetical protein